MVQVSFIQEMYVYWHNLLINLDYLKEVDDYGGVMLYTPYCVDSLQSAITTVDL
ncbi:14824_t:CDS:1, partial [Gigaspora margarita]